MVYMFNNTKWNLRETGFIETYLHSFLTHWRESRSPRSNTSLQLEKAPLRLPNSNFTIAQLEYTF